MALRDQPYLPLYIQDFLTDEKLMVCSAETTGVYIRLLCILHKQKEYGVFLLKQNVKHDVPTCLDFASQLDLFMPYKEKVIESSIQELLLHDVIQQEGSKLLQKRMIKDNDISLKRASAGSTGGKKTQLAKAKVKASAQANSENESEDETESISLESIIEMIKELPDIKLDSLTISSVVFHAIDDFSIKYCITPQKWRKYIDKLKESDLIMGRSLGKQARTWALSLPWLCKEETLIRAFSDGYKNVVVKTDGREFI
jgi:uncharacterized protein YdaU (DUF1376 family)